MKMLLKILLVILVLLAIYIYLEYRAFQKKVDVGVALAKNAIAYEQHPAEPEKRILVMGDSTGVGVGAADSTQSLAGRLGADYPRADITNISASGAKVADVANQWASVEGEHFDLVYIQIGGNDIVRFTKFSAIETGLAAMIEKAKMFGDLVVVATSGNIGTAQIFPKGTRWLIRIRTLQAREIFKLAVSQETVTYVDLYKEGEVDPFAKDPAKYYAADSFHPSGDGYDVWYTEIHKTIESLPGWGI